MGEDDVSDMDKAMSPKVIVPIKETTQSPRVSKVPVKDTTMSPRISKIPIEVKRLQDRNISPTPKISKVPSIDGVMSPRVSRPIKNEAMPPKLMLETKSRPLSVMMKNS